MRSTVTHHHDEASDHNGRCLCGMQHTHGAHDALLVVDVQVDFVQPRVGALYVPAADTLLPRINRLLACGSFALRVVTQDWHPAAHSSFVTHGGPWPVHCVQGSAGAALHPDLHTARVDVCIRKGTRVEADSYSAFADEQGAATELHARLRAAAVTRVFVCGVAYDFCVYHTVMDARRLGYDVVLLEDACAAVDAEVRAPQCRAAMRDAGVVLCGVDAACTHAAAITC